MINFKFADLASFFSKKRFGNAYPNKNQDCTSSPEKRNLTNKNFSASASENLNCKRQNNKNSKNCKSENENLKNSNCERNEKGKSIKGYLTNNHLLLGFLPALYLISSIAIILILLSIRAYSGNHRHFLSLVNPSIVKNNFNDENKNKNYQKQNSNLNLQLNTDINNKTNKNYINNNKNDISNTIIKLHKINLTSSTTIKIPNFYDLQKLNPTAFNIYITLSCGSSLAISLILFSVLKQRFKVPEFQAHSFKLNIMLLVSLASNLLHLARAAAPPLFERYFRLGEEFQPELENQFKQTLFLSHILFSILFALYSIIIVNLIRNKNYDESKINFFSQLQSEAQDNKWFLYKYITLFYLCVFMLVYVLVLLQAAGIVSFGPFEALLQAYYQPVTALFPYFIQIINAVLVFTFYFELKFVNMALAHNLDVDYLFEEEENKDGI